MSLAEEHFHEIPIWNAECNCMRQSVRRTPNDLGGELKAKSYSVKTLAGALHAEAVGCKLSLDREVKTEIPVFNQLTGLIQTGGHDTLFPSSDVGLVAASDHYEVRCLSIVGALVRASGTRVADDVEIRL